MTRHKVRSRPCFGSLVLVSRQRVAAVHFSVRRARAMGLLPKAKVVYLKSGAVKGKRGTGPVSTRSLGPGARAGVGVSAESGGAPGRKHQQSALADQKPSSCCKHQALSRRWRDPYAPAGGSAAERQRRRQPSGNHPNPAPRQANRPRAPSKSCPTSRRPRARIAPQRGPLDPAEIEGARRGRAAAIRLRAIPRPRLIRRLQRPIRNQPMPSLQQRRRGSVPRKEMPSAPPDRSR